MDKIEMIRYITLSGERVSQFIGSQRACTPTCILFRLIEFSYNYTRWI